MKKKILVSVISDLVTDQRVQKECNTLHKMGFEVLLIGRKSKRSFGLQDLPFKTTRFYNPFQRGPFMYLVFNTQLFFFLLLKKAPYLWANDLDTLLPNFIVARLKGSILVYDSHEYFTESVYKKTSKKIWLWLEEKIFPHLKNVITVNNSIKNIYEKKYGVPITVVRNVPYFFKSDAAPNPILPAGKKILIIQGMGINENRGAEEAILMMPYLPDEFVLYFVGSGTILLKLKKMVQDIKLGSKVFFIDPLPYLQMMDYTRQSYLGLIFEKTEVTDEHKLALPNKLFDYLQAGIPVLSSEAVEIELIISKYGVGECFNSFEPSALAANIMAITEEKYRQWKSNTVDAARDFNWEAEEKVLIDFMARLR